MPHLSQLEAITALLLNIANFAQAGPASTVLTIDDGCAAKVVSLWLTS